MFQLVTSWLLTRTSVHRWLYRVRTRKQCVQNGKCRPTILREIIPFSWWSGWRVKSSNVRFFTLEKLMLNFIVGGCMQLARVNALQFLKLMASWRRTEESREVGCASNLNLRTSIALNTFLWISLSASFRVAVAHGALDDERRRRAMDSKSWL